MLREVIRDVLRRSFVAKRWRFYICWYIHGGYVGTTLNMHAHGIYMDMLDAILISYTQRIWLIFFEPVPMRSSVASSGFCLW